MDQIIIFATEGHHPAIGDIDTFIRHLQIMVKCATSE